MEFKYGDCAKKAISRMNEIAILTHNQINCVVMLLALYKSTEEVQDFFVNQNPEKDWLMIMDDLENEIAKGMESREFSGNVELDFDKDAEEVKELIKKYANGCIKAINIFFALMANENPAVKFLRFHGINIPREMAISARDDFD